MRVIRILTTLIATLVLVTSISARPAAAQTHLDVSLTVFHDSLAPYGNWAVSAHFGNVWLPRQVNTQWRPYSVGYWTYTDVGWTWVSDEPWAWATYHYGRWAFDPTLGWVWVPDTVWGPAWVAWRSGPDYTGWAPLPPGVVVSGAIDPHIDSFAFVFVRTQYLAEPRLVTYIEPPARNVTFVRLTTNATYYSVSGGVVINRGVRVETVEHVIGHAVPRLTIQATTTVAPARVANEHLVVYRPATVMVTEHARVASPVVAHVETPAQIAARQAEERRALETEQVQAREALEAKHKAELAQPPPGLTHQQVVARQEQEHKAQAENEARQKQAMNTRHQQEQHGRGGGE
jgi:hypothetical protein